MTADPQVRLRLNAIRRVGAPADATDLAEDNASGRW
jgi:hypothetical protein